MRTAYIDGDIIVYQIGFGAQSFFYKVGSLFTGKKSIAEEKARENNIKIEKIQQQVGINITERNLASLIDRIVEGSRSVHYKIFITEKGEKNNFRKKFKKYVPYKEHRRGAPKPLYYDRIRNILIKKYGAIVVKGQEADDSLGIAQYAHRDEIDESVICTIDKDLDMIPGWHYNWRKERLYFLDLGEARDHFYLQMLQGDKADNISGVRGIGPVKAANIINKLDTNSEKEERILSHYQWCYDTADDYNRGNEVFLETGRLLWIRTKEGEIWEPIINLEENYVQST